MHSQRWTTEPDRRNFKSLMSQNPGSHAHPDASGAAPRVEAPLAIELDSMGCAVRVYGRLIRLPASEYRVLALLTARPLRWHTASSLAETAALGMNALRCAICSLRMKLPPGTIASRYRLGYRISPVAMKASLN